VTDRQPSSGWRSTPYSNAMTITIPIPEWLVSPMFWSGFAAGAVVGLGITITILYFAYFKKLSVYK
jgi:hypothetical protein